MAEPKRPRDGLERVLEGTAQGRRAPKVGVQNVQAKQEL